MNSITSFFAGIMAFVSSLFGNTPPQPIIPSPAPIVEQSSTTQEIVQTNTVTPTASSTLQSSSTEYLQTHRSVAKDFTIIYPPTLIEIGCGNSETMCLGISNGEGKMATEALSVSVKNHNSLEAWYTSTTKQGYYNASTTPPRFKDVTINGLPAREILDQKESFDRGGAPCHVIAILYKESVFEICDNLHNEVTKHIINSFTFTSTKSKEEI